MHPSRAHQPKVLVVVGTRPEAIKMIPVIHALQRDGRFRLVVVSTGQHAEMVDELFCRAGVMKDVDLGVNRLGRLTLNELFAKVLLGVEEVWSSAQVPEQMVGTGRRTPSGAMACLVHGDTTSAVAAALASFHLRIPVVHVEAGLRTENTGSPFPEEANRQILARLAAFHLAPTSTNKSNLVHEGVDYERILVTGNTSIDALRWQVDQREPYADPALADLEQDETTRVVVVTAHRRENWGRGLAGIGDAVARLAHIYPQVRFVVPLHPNPLVQDALRPRLAPYRNVSLVEPLGYADFSRLLARACLAISDSGGVQEEAPALGTPVLVTRETTERTEGIVAGTLELVGTDSERIVSSARALLDDDEAYAARVARPNPYGDGQAAERIVQALGYVVFGSPAPAPFGSGMQRDVVLGRFGQVPDGVPALPGETSEVSSSGPVIPTQPGRAVPVPGGGAVA